MSKLSCLVLALSVMSFSVGCAEQKGRKKDDKKAVDKKSDTKSDDKKSDTKPAAKN